MHRALSSNRLVHSTCPARGALLAVFACMAQPVLADDVTIYRCTDAAGKLTLRDTPCAKGQAQQVRSMIRPQDGKPPSQPTQPTAAPSMPAPTRVVVRNPPRPLYSCVRPDGSDYASDTNEGAPRWVPLWTLGYPVIVGGNLLGNRIGAPTPAPPSQSPGPPRPPRPPQVDGHGHGVHAAPWAGGGTWVRDECHALPQAEVCARLRDRRDAIRTRFFNAQPTERSTLNNEERGINARLADDCGGT